MISYLLLTYLLSIIGISFYFLFIKKRAATQYQKITLLTIVLLSLGVPFFVDGFSSSLTSTYQSCINQHPIPETVYMAYCPAGGDEMHMCFEVAKETEHFCNCQQIAEANLLLFKKNSLYDFYIQNEWVINYIIFFIAFWVGLNLLIRIGYLIYLVLNSKKEICTIGNYSFTILHTPRKHAVSSFYLHKPYIVWQAEMALLSAEEKEAILWHEISHLQQFDTWIKIALQSIQTIWFFNPAFYWLNKEVSRLNEHIADELAVLKTGNVQWYASVLVKMKRFQLNPPLLSHAFSAKRKYLNNNNNSQLKKRIQHLIAPNSSKPLRKYSAFVLIAPLLICLSVTSYFALPATAKYVDEIKLYEYLQKENIKTGKSVFCKNCVANEFLLVD